MNPISGEQGISASASSSFPNNNLRFKKALSQRTTATEDPVSSFPITTLPLADPGYAYALAPPQPLSDDFRIDPHHFSVATFATTSSTNSFSSTDSKDFSSYPSLYTTTTASSMSPPPHSPIYHSAAAAKAAVHAEHRCSSTGSCTSSNSSTSSCNGYHNLPPPNSNLHLNLNGHSDYLSNLGGSHLHSPARSLSGGTGGANSVHSFSSLDSDENVNRRSGSRRLFEKSKGAPTHTSLLEQPEFAIPNRCLKVEESADDESGDVNSDSQSPHALLKSLERLELSKADMSFNLQDELSFHLTSADESNNTDSLSSVTSATTASSSLFMSTNNKDNLSALKNLHKPESISSNYKAQYQTQGQQPRAFLTDPRLLQSDSSSLTLNNANDSSTITSETITHNIDRDGSTRTHVVQSERENFKFPTSTLAFGAGFQDNNNVKASEGEDDNIIIVSRPRSKNISPQQHSFDTLRGLDSLRTSSSHSSAHAAGTAAPERNLLGRTSFESTYSNGSQDSVHLDLTLDLDSVIHNALVESTGTPTDDGANCRSPTITTSAAYSARTAGAYHTNNNNVYNLMRAPTRPEKTETSDRPHFSVLDETFIEYHGSALYSAGLCDASVSPVIANFQSREVNSKTNNNNNNHAKGIKSIVKIGSSVKNLAKKISHKNDGDNTDNYD